MDHVSSSSDSLINDLLEDHWFFKNLFTRRSRVIRNCYSDPCSSSSSLSSSSSSLICSDNKEDSDSESLIKETSIDRRKGESQMKLTSQVFEKIRVDEPFLQKKESMLPPKSGSRSAPGKIQEASTKHVLIRAPSLPPRMDKREVDFEAKKMISKLTRQFSEKIRVLEPTGPSERFLQKKQEKEINARNKRRTSSSSNVKDCLQRTQTMPNYIGREKDNEEDEFEDHESDSRMGFLIREALTNSHNVPKVSSNQRQRPPKNLMISEDTIMVKQGSSSPKTLRKTLSSIETTKELQRLKDYDHQLDESRVMNGLVTPPRVPKDSRKEMKDQIKFWARAVATNVRQEC